MGGASAPPFFRHFPFKIGDLGAHPGKICLPLILICLPQIFLSLPLTQLQRQNLFLIKFQSVFAPLSFQLVDYQ